MDIYRTQLFCICGKEMKYKCVKCKAVYYCSKDCQKKDWKEHKKICSTKLIAPEIKLKTTFYRTYHSTKDMKLEIPSNIKTMTVAEIGKYIAKQKATISKIISNINLYEIYGMLLDNPDSDVRSEIIKVMNRILRAVIKITRSEVEREKDTIVHKFLIYVDEEDKRKYITLVLVCYYHNRVDAAIRPVYGYLSSYKDGILKEYIIKDKVFLPTKDALFDGVHIGDFSILPESINKTPYQVLDIFTGLTGENVSL